MHAARKILPNEDFVYFADTQNAPYGNKPKNEITQHVLSCCWRVKSLSNPKAIVLACNTATATSIAEVRASFNDTIIVGVEPAILPALSQTYGQILTISTVATLEYNTLIKQHMHKTNTSFLALPDLATLIDSSIHDLPSIQEKIDSALLQFKNNIQSVVIGCTHYSFVKPQIAQALGGKVVFFDSAPGVAHRLRFCLARDGLLNKTKRTGSTRIYTTCGSLETRTQMNMFLTNTLSTS